MIFSISHGRGQCPLARQAGLFFFRLIVVSEALGILDTATSADGMLTLRPWAKAAMTERGCLFAGNLYSTNLANFEMVILFLLFPFSAVESSSDARLA
eukprot:s4672_g8.t1